MGTPGSGRKRAPIKDRFSAEDEALSSIAREDTKAQSPSCQPRYSKPTQCNPTATVLEACGGDSSAISYLRLFTNDSCETEAQS